MEEKEQGASPPSLDLETPNMSEENDMREKEAGFI